MNVSSSLKAPAEIVTTIFRETETIIKKAWSILDAAAEKKAPSEYLSPNAIKSIQGGENE